MPTPFRSRAMYSLVAVLFVFVLATGWIFFGVPAMPTPRTRDGHEPPIGPRIEPPVLRSEPDAGDLTPLPEPSYDDEPLPSPLGSAPRTQILVSDPGTRFLERALERLAGPEGRSRFHEHTDLDVVLQSPDYNPTRVQLDPDRRLQLEALVRPHDTRIGDARHFEAVEARMALIDAIGRGEGSMSTTTRNEVTSESMAGKLHFADLPGPTKGTRRRIHLVAETSPGLARAKNELARLREQRASTIKAWLVERSRGR